MNFKKLNSALWLFVAGSFLRIVTYCFLDPHNNDPHYGYVKFIVDNHKLPLSEPPVGLSYHPPLYYLLGTPFFVEGSPKTVQFLSLILSLMTLGMFYKLIFKTKLINKAYQKLCFAFVCFFPQFILFSLFVSNDSLTFLLGALLVYCFYRFSNELSLKHLLILAVVSCLGLLTKATFLAYTPVVFLAIVFTLVVSKFPKQRIVIFSSIFIIVQVFGTFKYLQNWLFLGRPFITNMEFGYSFVERQSGTFIGLMSLIDINVFKLIGRPTNVNDSNLHSFPLLLYSTFWYQFIPESNFKGNVLVPFKYLGSVIYAFAVMPTAVCLWGLVKSAPKYVTLIASRDPIMRTRLLAVLLLLPNLGLLLIVEFKYDVWSILQGRSLFPSLIGFFVLFNEGMELIRENIRVELAAKYAVYSLLGFFTLYFISEFGILPNK